MLLFTIRTYHYTARFAIYALPPLIGAAVAVAVMLNVKVFRDVPLALAAFFLVGCSGALAARGVAYAGRFSVHLAGAGCALTICALAALVRTIGSSRSSDPARG